MRWSASVVRREAYCGPQSCWRLSDGVRRFGVAGERAALQLGALLATMWYLHT